MVAVNCDISDLCTRQFFGRKPRLETEEMHRVLLASFTAAASRRMAMLNEDSAEPPVDAA